MPKAFIPENDILDQEEERGQKQRRILGEGPNPQLRENIEKRWNAAGYFNQLPEKEQARFIGSVMAEIRIHRELFNDILGENSAAVIENLQSRELLPADLGVMINQYLGEYLKDQSEEDALSAETVVALVTRNLAEDLLTRVEKYKTQNILDADQEGVDVDVKDFGVAKTSINHIIESTDRDLEHTLKKVISFMKKHVFGAKAEDISFTILNENNAYGERRFFTTIKAEGEPTKSQNNETGKPSEKLEIKGPHYDADTHTVYCDIINKNNLLGTIEIRLKKDEEFDDHDIKMLTQIESRLDTYVHLELVSRKIERVVAKGEEILEKNNKQTDFEKGIQEIVELTCRNSRAQKAKIIFKKPGLKEEIFAYEYTREGGIIRWELEPHLAELLCDHETNHGISFDYMSGAKVIGPGIEEHNTVTGDINDISRPEHPVIGKIILINEEEGLTDEERRILQQTSGLIDAHIARRKMNLALLSKTMDPKVAEALSNGELVENCRENLTMFYVDIAAYTQKCQQLSQLKHGDKIFRLAETFLTKVQQIGEKYGAVWGGAVGDCGIMFFGPPYYKNGKDGLGMEEKRHDYHALNGLKAYVAIQYAMKDVNAAYEKILIEVAEDVYRESLTKIIGEEKRKAYLLDRLGREYQLKPNIEVTTGLYNGEVNIGIVNLPSSQIYTVLDDAMNMAARYQSAALYSEALIPLQTKNYVQALMESDEKVPCDSEGHGQTWSEFLEEDLGIDPMKEEMEIKFVEEYYFMKSTRGPNLGYRVQTHQQRVDSKRETIKEGQLMSEKELLTHEGEYAIISQNPHPTDNTVTLYLRTLTQPHTTFKARVAYGKMTTSEKKRMVSEKEALRRGNQDEDHILVVKNYHLEAYVYESMETKLGAMLQEKIASDTSLSLINDDEVPVGIYEVMHSERDANSDDYDIYHLRKSGKTFNARIPIQRVKAHKEDAGITQSPDFKSKYDDHFFALKNSIHKRGQGWPKAKELIYIQGSVYYTMQVEGITQDTEN